MSCEPFDIKQFDIRNALKTVHPEAWSWTLACCGYDRERAMEVLHDVYVKILEEKARFEGRSTFKTWVFGVIRMTARSHTRKARLTAFLFQPFDQIDVVGIEQPVETMNPCGRLISQSIKSLSRRQQEVVWLVFYHDLTVEEAANILQISLGSARTHYARAKGRLRQKLSENGVDGI